MIKKLFLFSILLALLVGPVYAAPFNATVPGDRNLGQEYSWSVKNSSGYAGAEYHYQVYDYRFIGDEYHYYSVAWGQWYTQAAGPGWTWLAVWIRGWNEGQTSWVGYGQDRFPVWIYDNISMTPEPVHMQDLEISWKGSGRRLPVVIAEIENNTARNERGMLITERYGWKDGIERDRLETGYSNRFDGYALYRVPVNTRLEDIRVAGWFGYWGTAIWHLAPIEIHQENLEQKREDQIRMVKDQRERGIRISDRFGKRVKV